MAEPNRVILIVDRQERAAIKLRELIEFMDTPLVDTAAPEQWRQRLGDRRLEALFVGSELTDAEVHELIRDVGRLDCNVPVVIMQGGAHG